MYVAAEPIQLGKNDRGFVLARHLEGGCQLRPAVERVGALTRLSLQGLDQVIALGLGETSQPGLLCLKTKA
jgi:hypothetical protein